MEQQREFKLRHPSFQMTHDEALAETLATRSGGSVARRVLIVIVGDGRRQWATVQGAHTFGRDHRISSHRWAREHVDDDASRRGWRSGWAAST